MTISQGALAPTSAITGHITVIDGQATTTTQDIAEVYGKRHDHVLRIVRQRMAEAPEAWRLPNFGETVVERPNPSGGEPIKSPVIRMTKKGFHFVVGKFTGAKAVQHQIAFADEFERMEAELARKPSPSTTSPLRDGDRFLLCFDDNGKYHMRPFGQNDCIVDTSSESALFTLLYEYLPLSMVSTALEILGRRVADHLDAFQKRLGRPSPSLSAAKNESAILTDSPKPASPSESAASARSWKDPEAAHAALKSMRLRNTQITGWPGFITPEGVEHLYRSGVIGPRQIARLRRLVA